MGLTSMLKVHVQATQSPIALLHKLSRKMSDTVTKSKDDEWWSIYFFQREGFDSPIFVSDKEGLGIKVPNPKTFTVGDVRAAVGSRRTVDVMDVQTQKNKFMTMKDWQKYFDTGGGH